MRAFDSDPCTVCAHPPGVGVYVVPHLLSPGLSYPIPLPDKQLALPDGL